jgi:hypothetical protein
MGKLTHQSRMSCSLPDLAKPTTSGRTQSHGSGHNALLLSWYSETTEVGNQCFRHCQYLLVGNGVGLQSLDEIIHGYQDVSVPLVSQRERPCYIDGYPFEWGPNIALVHKALTAGSGPAIGCTRVTAGTPFPNINVLPEASSTFCGPCSGSCPHLGALQTVHYGVRSAHPSFCSKGGLSGLFLIACQ